MKPFSIYFPQFYPTPTNDKAWGYGFTDWTLVATANLHDRWLRRAPRRGFYDGSDPAVHMAAMDEMALHGLAGTAVYHYWFYSHQELPAFEDTLRTRRAPVPWFLIWASEGWSRRWIGDPTAIVDLTRSPSASEITLHCDYLLGCFDRPEYFRLRGKPVFVWYNLAHFDRPGEVIAQYRERFHVAGVDVALGHFMKSPFDAQYSKLVDFTYLFEPRLFFGMRRKDRGSAAKRLFDRFRSALGESASSRLLVALDRLQPKGKTYLASDFLKYFESDEREALLRQIDGPVQDVLSPGWNNTPRYADRYTALENIDPTAFARLAGLAEARQPELPPLINAWNEWSEGAAIEPCAYFGTRYLDALSPISGCVNLVPNNPHPEQPNAKVSP